MSLYAEAVAAERAAKIARDMADHEAGIDALREENKRMRDRIERLRGALKTASGWVWDGAANEAEANDRANQLLDMAGDMEPPLMGSNV
jgi:hypothetical protein